MPTYELVLLLRHALRVSENCRCSRVKQFHLFYLPLIHLENNKPNLNIPSRLFFQPQLKDTIKRSTHHIFDRGGFIRKIEYLGFNKLPYKISKNQKSYNEAEQLLVTFDVSSQQKGDLHDELKTDIDVIRARIYDFKAPFPYQCDLEDDLKPPPERKEVKKLLELEKRKNYRKPVQGTYYPQTGLDYWPFDH